jgi:hypothetical protein
MCAMSGYSLLVAGAPLAVSSFFRDLSQEIHEGRSVGESNRPLGVGPLVAPMSAWAGRRLTHRIQRSAPSDTVVFAICRRSQLSDRAELR